MRELWSGRRVPAPTTVVALIALVAALSGSAVALKGKGSVKTNDIKKGAVTSAKIADQTIKSRDLKDGAAVAPADLVPTVRMWARVSSQATLINASVPGATVSRVADAPGQYAVNFNQGDISSCAAIAQLMSFAPGGVIPNGTAATEVSGQGTGIIRVDTTDPAGTKQDRGFALVVFC
jgi:hypothetical protein